VPIEYLDTPAASKFEYLDEKPEKSISGFGKNLMEDVKGTGKGLMSLAEGFTEHPIDTAVNVAKGLPGAVVEEGKRLGVGKLFTEGPVSMGNQFREAAYDKPLTTALDVIPAAGVAGKALGIGGKVAKGADMASQAAKVAPVAEDLAAGAAKAAPGAAEKAAGPAAAAEANPLQAVNEFVTKKYGQASAQPGWSEKVAKYLQDTSRNLGAKDIGLQPRQIQSMGQGFKGIEKAEALVDYAREKGYFDPKLTDIARKEKIKAAMEKTGQQVNAIRSLADERGVSPKDAIFNEVRAQLEKDYKIDAPREIQKVLAKIKNADPTFSGMADLATELNKAKTSMKSLAQHPGPTTDAANIVSRINNEAIKATLNPAEQELYSTSLRDFGAHKKLEQAVAAAGRRGMAARSNQRGVLGRLFQEALDRGGYRMAGNVADRTAKAILRDPSKVKTLPQFFEELAHEAGDVLDETLDIPGMAHGGIVDGELDNFLAVKYKQKER